MSCTTCITTTTVTTWRNCAHIPDSTVPLTIQAKDVKEGDYLDTAGTDHRDPGVHRVFLDAERDRTAPSSRYAASYTLHRYGTTHLVLGGTETVKVWRPVANMTDNDPRPIDVRQDVPCRTLTDAHRAGKKGLAAMFPIGSVWEVGPFCWDRDPMVVKITGEPFTSGINYSSRPEDAEARGMAAWFLPTETLYTPFAPTPGRGKGREGQPPGVLCALTPVMAAKAGVACCDCATYVPPCNARILSCNAGVVQSMRAEQENLLQTIREQQGQIEDLREALRITERDYKQAKVTLTAIRKSFDS